MRIRHLNLIFGIDNVAPVDVLPVFFSTVFMEATHFLVDPYY